MQRASLILLCWVFAHAQYSEKQIQKHLLKQGMDPITAHFKAYTLWKKQQNDAAAAAAAKHAAAVAAASRRKAAILKGLADSGVTGMAAFWKMESMKGGASPHPAAHPATHLEKQRRVPKPWETPSAGVHRDAPALKSKVKELEAKGLDPISAHSKAKAQLQKENAGRPHILGLKVGTPQKEGKAARAAAYLREMLLSAEAAHAKALTKIMRNPGRSRR
jgi:hypothetical protein